ncbi:MAG: hypothetical protein K6G69_10320 [Lachnospiraceae bacterium]|nr:hypothetical protein [Lachnospiraceae bacterium]
MATKGASNRYGNARGGRNGHPTVHIGFQWARAFNKYTLQDHYDRHGAQVGASSKESYEAHAVKFANTVNRKDCVSFIDGKGSTYKYNRVTNEFAVITKKGIVITYFKPTAGYIYYLNEKKGKARYGRYRKV